MVAGGSSGMGLALAVYLIAGSRGGNRVEEVVKNPPAMPPAEQPRLAPPAEPEAVPPRPAPEPELGDREKDAFRKLGSSMSFVGVLGLLFGVMTIVGAIVTISVGSYIQAAVLGVAAALQIMIAVWTAQGGRALTSIYTTRGRDVTFLMQGVTQLRRIYGFALVMIVLLGGSGLVLIGYAMAGEGKKVIKSIVDSLIF